LPRRAADRFRLGNNGPPAPCAKADIVPLPQPAPSPALLPVHQAIVSCTKCPRLREYCAEIGRVKRAAFRDDTYWTRPVPGFGDPAARVLVVGLAPAAHGANRTGRNFTGDGVGGSGDFLMAAMHANGLASQPTSRGLQDGLRLRDAYIAAAARCAPPDNKPTPEELARCRPHLEAEWQQLTGVSVVVCLGRVAYDVCSQILEARRLHLPKPRPAFEHGAIVRVPGGPSLVMSYHPSRQNTNTGRLTPSMLSSVFATARTLMDR
jgi:uracil-DNA glycosylase family 4